MSSRETGAVSGEQDAPVERAVRRSLRAACAPWKTVLVPSFLFQLGKLRLGGTGDLRESLSRLMARLTAKPVSQVWHWCPHAPRVHLGAVSVSCPSCRPETSEGAQCRGQDKAAEEA